MDIADPIEAGPGIVLYTADFYALAKAKLNPGGVIVTQSGPGGLFTHTECFTAIHKTLASEFETVVPYAVGIPSFGSDWAFNLAFGADAAPARGAAAARGGAAGARDAVAGRRAADVDADIAARVKGGAAALRFYDGVSHGGIFGLSKPIRASLAAETRIITIANPVFMY